ncbi:hypothetical protein Ahy_B05g078800 isoform B [Arachis hypogaea]|uniref:Uncharacterized protein n=1 Tax=Arachis hypogaea TaxID=3818 RepID=A0A444Z878_ARAHY|nr:hypothetical protein Ahy_B05g078800 isoform B [Arachis hypogaea]
MVSPVDMLNRRPEEYANNWLIVGPYNKTYEFLVQHVPSKEFWEKHGYANIFPPTYGRAKDQQRREKKGVLHQSHNQILIESNKNMDK